MQRFLLIESKVHSHFYHKYNYQLEYTTCLVYFFDDEIEIDGSIQAVSTSSMVGYSSSSCGRVDDYGFIGFHAEYHRV